MKACLRVLMVASASLILNSTCALSQDPVQRNYASRNDYPLASLTEYYFRSKTETTSDGKLLALDAVDHVAPDYGMHRFEVDLIKSMLRASVEVSNVTASKALPELIARTWREEPPVSWTWNGLLAVTDFLDRMHLSQGSDYSEMLDEMERRLEHTKNGFQDGYFSRTELSERSISVASRQVTPAARRAKCRQYLAIIPSDFALRSFVVSTFEQLDAETRKSEIEIHRDDLKRCLELLCQEADLASQYPLAKTKLMIELADTYSANTEKKDKKDLLCQAQVACNHAKGAALAMKTKALEQEAKKVGIEVKGLADYRWRLLRQRIALGLFLLADPGSNSQEAANLAVACKDVLEYHSPGKLPLDSVLSVASSFFVAVNSCEPIRQEGHASDVKMLEQRLRDLRQGSQKQKQLEEVLMLQGRIRREKEREPNEVEIAELQAIASGGADADNQARATMDLGMLYLGSGQYEEATWIVSEVYEKQLVEVLAKMKLGKVEDAKVVLKKLITDTQEAVMDSNFRSLMERLLLCEFSVFEATSIAGDNAKQELAAKHVNALHDDITTLRDKLRNDSDSTKWQSAEPFLSTLAVENANHRAVLDFASGDETRKHTAMKAWDDQSKFQSNALPALQIYIRLRARYQLLNARCSMNAQFRDDDVRQVSELLKETNIEFKQQYPNLRYNIGVLLLEQYSKKGSVLPPGNVIRQLAEVTCKIGLELRNQTSPNPDQRETLFRKYSLAFDLSVPLLADIGLYEDAIKLGSQTTNQSLRDLTQGIFSCSRKTEQEIQLPKRFLAYYVGADCTLIFWKLRDNTMKHEKSTTGRRKLSKLTHDYINKLARNSDLESSGELAEVLVPKRLLEDLRTFSKDLKEECLYVLPHGPLFRLPLESLMVSFDEGKPQYLQDSLPPTVYLQTLRSSISDGHDGAYNRPPERGLDIQTCREVSKGEPGEGWKTLKWFDEEYGKESILAELKNGYPIVHFRAHGAKASDSGLVADAELRISRKESLKTTELLSHFGCGGIHSDLVVLSSCESQDVKATALRFGGNTHEAIGTNFLLAGAKNVIAAHWSVDAESAITLCHNTIKEYEQLSSKTAPTQERAAIALYAAKKRLKESSNPPEWHTPFHWCAFTTNALQLDVSCEQANPSSTELSKWTSQSLELPYIENGDQTVVSGDDAFKQDRIVTSSP